MIRDPDGLRVVWLFGKPYWWDRDDGQLALRPAPPEPAPSAGPLTFDKIAELFSGPLPDGPTKEKRHA